MSIYMGNTYLADNMTQKGNIAETALDHIYIMKEMKERVKGHKLETSANRPPTNNCRDKEARRKPRKEQSHSEEKHEELHERKMEYQSGKEKVGEDWTNRGCE